MRRQAQLPVELLELVVTHVPDTDHHAVALPASHIVTKTLFSCMLACKAATAISVDLLHRHCLYIDCPWRLRALLRAYTTHRTPLPGRSNDPTEIRRNASTALFLKPFSDDTIDEANVVNSLSKLFGLLSSVLRRLVIDMPLRSYYPDEPSASNLRLALRNAFLQLNVLEEFVSVRDELYLSTILPSDFIIEPPVWSAWTSLRRLALYNLDMDTELTAFINAMPSLQTLILTRPDVNEDIEQLYLHWNPRLHIGIVNTWRDHAEEDRSALTHSSPEGFGSATLHRVIRTIPSEQSRPLPIKDIICVDGQHPVTEDRRSQRNQGLGDGRRRSTNNWAAYDLGYVFNDIRVCQEWVKQNALSGDLWPEIHPDWPPKTVECSVQDMR